MGNPNDRCAKDYSGQPCGIYRGNHFANIFDHVFVEPAPQPPADATTTRRKFEELVDAVGDLPTTALATSGLHPAALNVAGDGDAAAVREIAELLWLNLLNSSGDQIDFSMMEDAARAGIARGRALGAREAVEYLATPDATEEAAKGLVENPSWDYDGATEAEKEYYRRFARKCIARLADAIARRAGREGK